MKTWQKAAMVVLSLGQVVCNVVALMLPEYIVGDLPVYDAVAWADQVNYNQLQDIVSDFGDETATAPTRIGLFRSFINGVLSGGNREGLVAVFGFALLSTTASILTFTYSLQVVFHLCKKDCAAKCKSISVKLKQIAKANFSAGVSDMAVAAMIGFSANDLPGEKLGTSSYLSIAGGISALLYHVVQGKIKPKKSTQPPEDIDDKLMAKETTSV